jgi:hypothetical protein
MGTLRTGEKIVSAGASPLRASIGEQIAAKQTEEAKAEADRKAKEELGTAPTRAMSSSNPPPPAATPTLDAFKSELEAEKAAEAARLAREAAETGDMPVSVDVSLTGLAPVQAPVPAPAPEPATDATRSPNPVILGVPVAPPEPPREAPPTLSNFVMGGRFMSDAKAALTEFRKQHLGKMMFFGPLIAIASAIVVVTLAVDYFGDAREGSAPIAAPDLPISTTLRATEPVVEPVAPIPPPPIVAPTEPGLRGRRGERVTMRARDAYPVSCLTAWVVDHTDDAVYLCTPGQRRGNDMCDCNVTGVVP